MPWIKGESYRRMCKVSGPNNARADLALFATSTVDIRHWGIGLEYPVVSLKGEMTLRGKAYHVRADWAKVGDRWTSPHNANWAGLSRSAERRNWCSETPRGAYSCRYGEGYATGPKGAVEAWNDLAQAWALEFLGKPEVGQMTDEAEAQALAALAVWAREVADSYSALADRAKAGEWNRETGEVGTVRDVR